jgi:hypothetical protein
MAPIEKLAREICWAGFSCAEARKGKTKAKYWRDISGLARQMHLSEAGRFAYLLGAIEPSVLKEVLAEADAQISEVA